MLRFKCFARRVFRRLAGGQLQRAAYEPSRLAQEIRTAIARCRNPHGIRHSGSELTPEELTNIRVYDGANRGVVNILARTVSYDRFFQAAHRRAKGRAPGP